MNPDELYIKWASVWTQCLCMRPIWDFINRSFFQEGCPGAHKHCPFGGRPRTEAWTQHWPQWGLMQGPLLLQRGLWAVERFVTGLHSTIRASLRPGTAFFFIDIKLLCGTCFRQHEQKHRYLDMHPQGKVIWVIQRSEIAT